MDKATIEITKEEAALLPLLYKVPVQNMTIESALKVVELYGQVASLVAKAQAAFEKEDDNSPT